MLSVAQLRELVTVEQWTDRLLGYLQLVGFNATSWQPGSKPRALVNAVSYVAADLSSVIVEIVDLGFNDSAKGAWLTLYSASVFDNVRKPAIFTVGVFRLTNTGTVPHTVQPGQLVFGNASGRTFRNTTGGTVAANGGQLNVTVTAESAGAAWNLVDNDTSLTLRTPLAGVTVSNPPGTTGAWITTYGTDEETDEELRLRNRTKWATLSVEKVRDAFVQIALASHPNIRKVGIDDANPRGPATLDVYIAGSSSTLGIAEDRAAQNAFAERTFWTQVYGQAATLTSAVLVERAPAHPLDLAATVYYSAAYDAAVVAAAVDSALSEWLKTVPLGGFSYPPPGHLLQLNDIEFIIRGVPGVVGVAVTAPATNVSVGSWAVVTRGNWALTYTAV